MSDNEQEIWIQCVNFAHVVINLCVVYFPEHTTVLFASFTSEQFHIQYLLITTKDMNLHHGKTAYQHDKYWVWNFYSVYPECPHDSIISQLV